MKFKRIVSDILGIFNFLQLRIGNDGLQVKHKNCTRKQTFYLTVIVLILNEKGKHIILQF